MPEPSRIRIIGTHAVLGERSGPSPEIRFSARKKSLLLLACLGLGVVEGRVVERDECGAVVESLRGTKAGFTRYGRRLLRSDCRAGSK